MRSIHLISPQLDLDARKATAAAHPFGGSGEIRACEPWVIADLHQSRVVRAQVRLVPRVLRHASVCQSHQAADRIEVNAIAAGKICQR